MKLAVDRCWVRVENTRTTCNITKVLFATGPQVYGCVACPMSASDELKALGFAGKPWLKVTQDLK